MLGSSLFSALPSCDTLHLEPGQSHLQQNAHFDNELALGVTGDERGTWHPQSCSSDKSC